MEQTSAYFYASQSFPSQQYPLLDYKNIPTSSQQSKIEKNSFRRRFSKEKAINQTKCDFQCWTEGGEQKQQTPQKILTALKR